MSTNQALAEWIAQRIATPTHLIHYSRITDIRFHYDGEACITFKALGHDRSIPLNITPERFVDEVAQISQRDRDRVSKMRKLECTCEPLWGKYHKDVCARSKYAAEHRAEVRKQLDGLLDTIPTHLANT